VTGTILEQVCAIAADIFSVPASQINGDSTPETIESWDSILHLNLALSLEDNFHLQLSPEEIERMRSVGEIAKLIETRLQSVPN
jgi:acyl carrier protein